MSFIFDHIAIAADNLEQGVAFIQQKFGVKIPFGGTHNQMGTHNHLMQIGQGIFLELITINKAAKPPLVPQKRWFDLDNPHQQNQLKQSPKLVTWIARTADIQAETHKLNIPIGDIHQVSRGKLNWQISIKQHGSHAEHGLFPTLIQWQDNQTPAPNMADLGIKLTEFTLTHPQPSHLTDLLANYAPSPQFKLIVKQGDYGLSANFINQYGDKICL